MAGEENEQSLRELVESENFRLPTDSRVTLQPAGVDPTLDRGLWGAIRNRTEAIGFDNYSNFINLVLCEPDSEATRAFKASKIDKKKIISEVSQAEKTRSIYGTDAYQLLKLATQAFLLFEAGVFVEPPRDGKTHSVLNPNKDVRNESGRIDDQVSYQDVKDRLTSYLGSSPGLLPYLDRIVTALVGLNPKSGGPFCEHLLEHRLTHPSLLELIWSYWQEEGMLVQTMNAISLRFQNKRGQAEHDPLANLEIDPLRPLNNLLWGFIQDEYNRLTVIRRAYEYDHHYGLTLYGRAVPELRSADSRSKFIEAFHNLLYRAATFYREDADTTVIADGFALLNALKEVHLILAEGAHNQFGDLPWTARAEMLIMQWLLSRPETREFLRGRAMVPYQERWMGQVDTMKRLQGWTDTSITQFRNLAVFGEQIMLSARYGDWSDVNNQDQAKIWARYWRPEIQTYIHSYQAATGVGLGEEIVDARSAATRYLQPSVLLRERLIRQKSPDRLPAATGSQMHPISRVAASALPAARRRALKPAGTE